MSALKQVKQPFIVSSVAIVTAVWIASAVIIQFLHGSKVNPQFDPFNFFSFFTIESNILAVIVLLLGAFIPLNKQTRSFSYLRGAVTLCMVTTGIVYGALLSGLEESLQTPIPWVNLVLHYIAPLVVFTWWIIVPSRHQFTLRHNLLWLIVPFAYMAYSLIRGAFVGWYPYPFLNPTDGGYGKVAIMSVIIFVVLVGVVGVLTWLSKRGTR